MKTKMGYWKLQVTNVLRDIQPYPFEIMSKKIR